MNIVAWALLALAVVVGGAPVEIGRESTIHPAAKVTIPDLK
jgi:hypothetical protein